MKVDLGKLDCKSICYDKDERGCIMKYYWLHFKEDKERGVREAWHLALSWSSSPSSGWLYQQDRKEWLFYTFDGNKKINIQFKGLTKRETMKRCVAILKLLNKMENGR